jgi:hypothetical protein
LSNSELRFRQIHLDFHTSEHIPGIGSDFDPEEFAATLERARVDSITCLPAATTAGSISIPPLFARGGIRTFRETC